MDKAKKAILFFLQEFTTIDVTIKANKITVKKIPITFCENVH